MGFRDYIRAVRHGWWVVLLAVLICVSAAAILTIRSTKMYETSVTFFVKTPADQLSMAAQGDAFGQKRVNSYVQLATTDRLLKPVLAQTRLLMTPNALASRITASGDPNSVLLTVKVTDPSPAESLQIGTAISTQFVKLVAELESAAANQDSTVRLELVSGPNLNTSPVEPRPLFNYAIAILLGLLSGIGSAVAKDVLNSSIRSPRDLERAVDGSVIGVIAFDDTAHDHPLIVEGHAKSVRAESFRQLRTNIEFVHVDAPAKVIVVTSSVAGEGKSSTATNLAVIFAESGKKVLLIEGDLRRPRVAEYLGLEGTVGLSNVLAGQVEIGEVLQPWGRGGLTVLASGSIPPNPSELLGSRAMAKLLDSMADIFDLILIDTPPLLPVTDGAVMAARADGAILVVRHGVTSRQQVNLAAAALHKVDAILLGSVLNMTPTKGAESYGYGYGYGYTSYENDSGRDSLVGEAAEAARDSVKPYANVGSYPRQNGKPQPELQPEDSRS